MSPTVWQSLVEDLSTLSVDVCVRASERIHRESTVEDVPNLLELLKSESFFVREAAAWPLAELVGPAALEQLLAAYQRGFDDGHDNDGFTAALLEIPALYPEETPPALRAITSAAAEPMRTHALWLLEFCEPQAAARRDDA